MKIILSICIATLLGVGASVINRPSTPQCDNAWTYFEMTNSCYWAGDLLDFKSAEANCVSLGGHLTSIANSFENSFILTLTESGERQNEEGMTWIGLQYLNGNWKWTDGSASTYQYWMEKDPSDTKKEQCTELLQDDLGKKKNTKGQWNNVECSSKMRKYICKKKPNY